MHAYYRPVYGNKFDKAAYLMNGNHCNASFQKLMSRMYNGNHAEMEG